MRYSSEEVHLAWHQVAKRSYQPQHQIFPNITTIGKWSLGTLSHYTQGLYLFQTHRKGNLLLLMCIEHSLKQKHQAIVWEFTEINYTFSPKNLQDCAGLAISP